MRELITIILFLKFQTSTHEEREYPEAMNPGLEVPLLEFNKSKTNW